MARAKGITLSNSEQNSGYAFHMRRFIAAVIFKSVRMKDEDDDRKQRTGYWVGVAVTIAACLVFLLLRVVKPHGLPGDAVILGNRDTGQTYVKVDGILYPALNLVSAHLIAGNAMPVRWVQRDEIDKFPTGPQVGIAGIVDFRVNTGGTSAFAACDTAPGPQLKSTKTTVIVGSLTSGDRASELSSTQGILATHNGNTYVVWGGKRTQIDISNRAITVNLGLDPAVTLPVPMSTGVFDALPATEPLVVPAIENAGAPSQFGLNGAPIGSVIDVRDVAGSKDRFYVVLNNGVQPVSDFVASMLRTSNSYGAATAPVVSPDQVVNVPQVNTLNVGYYPKSRLNFVDTAANPVLCVGWEKASTDRQATVTVYTGRGLPVPSTEDRRIVQLVRDDRDPASVEATHTLVLPDAVNFVTATSGLATSDSREHLWWISPQGTRYGIAADPNTLKGLGVDPREAQQAPWPILRMLGRGLPEGLELSKAAAMVAQDTVTSSGRLALLPTKTP